jgi:uncharacterized protein YcfL
MKKVLALLSIVALASCGSSTSTDVKNDSTEVVMDSTLTDSTVVSSEEIKVDSSTVEVK